MFNEDRLSHSRRLLRKINALNVYQINLYQHLNFMHKVNNQEMSSIFNDLIKRLVNKYLTNFSKSNFCLKTKILHKEEKDLESYSVFQNQIKSKLLMIENETIHF